MVSANPKRAAFSLAHFTAASLMSVETTFLAPSLAANTLTAPEPVPISSTLLPRKYSACSAMNGRMWILASAGENTPSPTTSLPITSRSSSVGARLVWRGALPFAGTGDGRMNHPRARPARKMIVGTRAFCMGLYSSRGCRRAATDTVQFGILR